MKKKKPKSQFSYTEIILVISIAAVVTGWTCANVSRWTNAEDNPPVEQAEAQPPEPPIEKQHDCFPMMDKDGVHTFCGHKSE